MGLYGYERKAIDAMIATILLIYIGVRLQAPALYFVLCGIDVFIQLIKFGGAMYKAGSGD